MNTTYNIIRKFECCGKKMLVVRMSGAACVMLEDDFNKIIVAEEE